MFLKTISAILLISLLMLMPASAGPTDPMATIKGPIDAAIAILNDPQYKSPGTRADQRDQIWKALKPMFDFRLISMRAVGGHWDGTTEGGQEAPEPPWFSSWAGRFSMGDERELGQPSGRRARTIWPRRRAC